MTEEIQWKSFPRPFSVQIFLRHRRCCFFENARHTSRERLGSPLHQRITTLRFCTSVTLESVNPRFQRDRVARREKEKDRERERKARRLVSLFVSRGDDKGHRNKKTLFRRIVIQLSPIFTVQVRSFHRSVKMLQFLSCYSQLCAPISFLVRRIEGNL